MLTPIPILKNGYSRSDGEVMSRPIEHAALGIKTKEGKGIYDAGVARDGQFQLAASKATSKKEEARLLAAGRKAYNDALAKALALNKPAKKMKGTSNNSFFAA
jgi:hypothetical protein